MSVIQELYGTLASMRRMGFPGRVILGCGGLYLLAGLVAFARPLSRRTPLLWGLVGISGLGALGGGLAMVIASRSQLLLTTGLAKADTELFPWAFAAATEKGEAGMLLLACGLLWTAVFGGVSVGASAIRGPAASHRPPVLATALVTMTGVVGALLLWRSVLVARAVMAAANAAMDPVAYSPAGQPTSSQAALEGLIEASTAPHAGSRAAVIAAFVFAAAIGCLLILRASKRAGSAPHALEKGLCVALFATGLLAFARTRAHSADLEARLPFESPVSSTPEEDARARRYPIVSLCDEWSPAHDGPGVELAEGGATLDGTVVAEPSKLVDLLRNKRALHEQLGRSRKIPPVVLLADASLPVASAARFVVAIRGVWPEGVVVVAALPAETWQSRTLGAFPRRIRTCPLPVVWDSAARPLSSLVTWQDMAREAASQGRIAP